MFIVSQVTRKTKPEIKQELQDWNYNFFEDFAMLGAPEKVAYNFKTLAAQFFLKDGHATFLQNAKWINAIEAPRTKSELQNKATCEWNKTALLGVPIQYKSL